MMFLLIIKCLRIVENLYTYWHILSKALLLMFFSGLICVASAIEADKEFKNPLFDFTLQDHNNNALQLHKYKGKTLLVNFIFTTCGATCPLQTQQLVEVQNKIPKGERATIQFLSITVDPKHDTPEKLKGYGKKMGVDFTDWTFATGAEQIIAKLTKLLNVYDPSKSAPKSNDHTNLLYLYDKNGLLMQKYNGNPIDVTRLAREILLLDQLKL
jgi:protein SCO1